MKDKIQKFSHFSVVIFSILKIQWIILYIYIKLNALAIIQLLIFIIIYSLVNMKKTDSLIFSN